MQSSKNNTTAGCAAIYKLPGERTCHAIHAEPEEIADLTGLEGRAGFVLAPFDPSGGCPILLYGGTPVAMPIGDGGEAGLPRDPGGTDDPRARDSYAADFNTLHSMLTCGDLSKVVLARSRKLPYDLRSEAESIFFRACSSHPSDYVALAVTPRDGIWVTATPELLTLRRGGSMSTVALAGTMRMEDGARLRWSAKNKEEQEVVARYVSSKLAAMAEGAVETEDRTVETASGLAHLQTTFAFTPRPGVRTMDVIAALHPTPAVCGMPKEAALKAIKAFEHCDRGYYSGFSGPVSHDGDAAVYVTLRCAKIEEGGCTLYAGGGIMPESREQDEWDETEAKMESMRHLITRKA